VEPFPAVCPRFFHIRKSLGKIVILSALLFDWMMRLRNAKGDSDCDEKKAVPEFCAGESIHEV
jgi:hypothetical protein